MVGKVLVTGASGYIASHVLDILLKSGYHVRGTVRSQEKADQIAARYPQYKDKLEFSIVEDIGTPSAFDASLIGITGVFHLASPFHFKVTTSNKVDLLDPAVKGTLGILQAAIKYPDIKRIVITSSFAAIRDGTKPSDHAFTEKDWNPVTQEEAEKGDAVTGYVASKKLAETAAWDFQKNNKPQFDIVTICPPMVYGPVLQHINKLEELNESSRTFYENVVGSIDLVPLPRAGLYVDVRDAAKAHVLAYEKPEASNQRYFVTNGNYDWQEVVDFVHKNYPNQTKAHVGTPGTYPKPAIIADNSKSISHLGLTYHSKEATFRDTIDQLLELKQQGK